MVLLAPLWLTLLAPWAIFVAWLWRRTTDERATTATFLWPAESPTPAQARSRRARPPAWVLAALASLLLMIFALAGPTIAGKATRVGVVVDASVALSAKSMKGTARDALIERLRRLVPDAGVTHVEWDVTLEGLAAPQASSLDAAGDFAFTARPTRAAVEAAISRAIATNDALIVLSGHMLDPTPANVAVIAPEVQPNVGIELAIATARPKPSLMVRVVGNVDRSALTLVVRTEGVEERRVVNLRDGAVDVFFDLPAATGEEIQVALIDAKDAQPIDDQAVLLRTAPQPRLVIDGTASEAASRFGAAYVRARSAGQPSSPLIRIRARPSTGATQPELIIADDPVVIADGDTAATDHPILRDVDLNNPRIPRLAEPPEGSWTTVARMGERPIILAREQPAAVWIGFPLDAADLRTVVLLSNAVEWLGRSATPEWRGELPASVGRDWRATGDNSPNLEASPGRYVDAAGKQVHVNMPAIIGPHGESRGDVSQLLRQAQRDARRSLRPSLSILASCVALAACMLARRQRRLS